jgi:hypothetical protein
MQGTLKGIRVCHVDSVYIEHHGRVAGGLVGSLSENCNYGVQLRVSGVWTDTNIGVQYTQGPYFYVEFPRDRVCPGPPSLRHGLLDHAQSSAADGPRLCRVACGADHSAPYVTL